MNEHDFEPVRGLPSDLPEGERLVFQCAPRWTRLACDAFHVRATAGYFAVMLVARTVAAVSGGEAPGRALVNALTVAPIGILAVGVLCLLAWLNARTTVYTLTSRRVVLRFGCALTKAINLPFSVIESGAVKAFADGTGDLALTLKRPNKIALLQLWPHVRPWRIASPQPTLRSIPQPAHVASLLAAAMKAELGVDLASAPVVTPATGSRARTGLARPEAAAA